MQQNKPSGIVAVVEDGTHSEEDIALVADGPTHYTDVWIPKRLIIFVLGENGFQLMRSWKVAMWL
jgi:hypothetical protein